MQIPGINELILKHIKKDKYEKYLELMPDLKAEKNEKLITIILTITASIILGIFAVNPTLSTITSLQKQLDDSKFFESKLQEKIKNLTILDQRYQEIQNDLPLIFEAVPQTSEIATLTASLQAVSNSSNVELITLQTLQVELSKQALAQKKYSSYKFDVTGQGNYQDLITFLDKLVNFQRILTINNISIVKTISSTETSLQVNMNGNAYFKQ
jgi:Tfp pilus assembly protein PilO